jgi:signal peptidase I
MPGHTVKRFSNLLLTAIAMALCFSLLAARMQTAGWLLFPALWLIAVTLLIIKKLPIRWPALLSLGIAAFLFIRSSILEKIELKGRSMEPGLHEGESLWICKLRPFLRLPQLTGLAGRPLAIPGLPTGSLKRGEIIAFTYPGMPPDHVLVKRVIAVAQDSYEFQNWGMLVNGELLAEPYLKETSSQEHTFSRPYLKQIPDFLLQMHPMILYSMQNGLPAKGKVPPDAVLVLGDNRRESLDSRSLGFIPLILVHGVAQEP